MALSTVKALNPLDFPNRDEFSRQVEILFSRASAFREIIDLLDTNKRAEQIARIRASLNQADKDYNIGGSTDARQSKTTTTK